MKLLIITVIVFALAMTALGLGFILKGRCLRFGCGSAREADKTERTDCPHCGPP